MSKPVFDLVRINKTKVNNQSAKFNAKGGAMNSSANEELYKYKAKKYHYKIQAKLKELMKNGQSCPAGYEKYLQPFSE